MLEVTIGLFILAILLMGVRRFHVRSRRLRRMYYGVYYARRTAPIGAAGSPFRRTSALG